MAFLTLASTTMKPICPTGSVKGLWTILEPTNLSRSSDSIYSDWRSPLKLLFFRCGESAIIKNWKYDFGERVFHDLDLFSMNNFVPEVQASYYLLSPNKCVWVYYSLLIKSGNTTQKRKKHSSNVICVGWNTKEKKLSYIR